MSVSNTNTATSSDSATNFVANWINSLITVAIAAVEAIALMFSVYYVPYILQKTICSKSKPFSIPILSYVCKQIEEFMKPSAEPRSPIVVIPTE